MSVVVKTILCRCCYLGNARAVCVCEREKKEERRRLGKRD